MQNKIILVGGYCAAGKSTFTRKLSRELNIPCFHKDTLKETLGDGFGSDSGEVFKKGSFTTFLLMLHIAEQFLQAGQVCILESNFSLREIEQIKILLEKYNAECLLFIFKGNLDVLFDRYAERSGERHWVHKSAGDRESFKKVMAERFELEEAAIGESVIIDTTSFEKVNYEDLFDTSKRFLEA